VGEVPEARRGYQWAPFDPQQQQRLPLLPPALLLLRIYCTVRARTAYQPERQTSVAYRPTAVGLLYGPYGLRRAVRVQQADEYYGSTSTQPYSSDYAQP
jgi:hypothetical protein